MSACANCARELRPDWKFCIHCGTPTGVVPPRPDAVAGPATASVAEPTAEPVSHAVGDGHPVTLPLAPPPVAPAAPRPRSAPGHASACGCVAGA
ncbi:zinc-ribbon domain-containing protein [Pseudolysinimonas kribbensis]|uniref:zinc-ribbon domain-containing protein n=1 Tax=Pseudolysinimonas kribbensis TaxID=433641 RepID=UPI003D67F3D7